MHRLKPYDRPSKSAVPSAREEYIRDHLATISVDAGKYELMATIGQGTFGIVSKGRERANRRNLVALKRIKLENDEFPIASLREMRILKALRHRNIVRFIEFCTSTRANCPPSYYIVMEYCDFDLEKLLRTDVVLKMADIKRIMQDMLNGLYFIHFSKIVHRDLKPQNILINTKGVVKLGDFGSARILYAPQVARRKKPLTRVAVTLWYRSPELLLCDRTYGLPVDMWSVGCILGQMWSRTAMMQGSVEQEQLKLIMRLCGPITPETWPGVEYLPMYNVLDLQKYAGVRQVRKYLWGMVSSEEACDLLDKLLVLDPKGRLDVDRALNHDFFWHDPLPGNLLRLLEQVNHKRSSSLASKTTKSHGRHKANDNQLFDRIW